MAKTKRETYIKLLKQVLLDITMTPKTDVARFNMLKAKAKGYLLKIETMKPKA